MGIETAIIVGGILSTGAAIWSSDNTRKAAHDAQDKARALADQQRQWATEQQQIQMDFQAAENARQIEAINAQTAAISNTPVPDVPAPEVSNPDASGAGAAARRRVLPPSYYSTILTSSSGSTGTSQRTVLGG